MTHLVKHLVKRLASGLALLSLPAALGLTAASATTLYTVQPVSYTFDQATACGTWCYHDASRSKLTDGRLGFVGWAADQGQSWVGWMNTPVVNIDFDFGNVTSISDVTVYTTQDHPGDVVLPSFKVWEKVGSNWEAVGGLKIRPSSANNHSSTDASAEALSFGLTDLGISSRYVRVSLLANGPFTFASEVKFESTVPQVPEASSIAMALAGVALSGLIARRRRA